MQRHRLNPPSQRHLSAVRLPRWQGRVCDSSMIYEDGTVFVQQRRGEEDGAMTMIRNPRFRYDETVIFDSNSSPVMLDSADGNRGVVSIESKIVEARDEGNGIGMCVVCQDQLINGRRIARLDCGHQFHPRCIQKWLCRKNNCPLCKATALHLPP